MNLEQWSQVATILGALAIPLSAAFIWVQLRYQTALTRAANAQALVELSSPLNLQLIQDPEVAKLWINGPEHNSTYEPVDQFRYKTLIIWWMMLHENIFLQRRLGLLEESIYRVWDRDLRSFIRYHKIENRWDEFSDTFEPTFAAYVQTTFEKSA